MKCFIIFLRLLLFITYGIPKVMRLIENPLSSSNSLQLPILLPFYFTYPSPRRPTPFLVLLLDMEEMVDHQDQPELEDERRVQNPGVQI